MRWHRRKPTSSKQERGTEMTPLLLTQAFATSVISPAAIFERAPVIKWFVIYLLAVSVIGTVLCIHDKISAKKRKRRIPEKTLFLFAILGASGAMYLTMLLIRHKTRHPSFMIGFPCIIAAQIALAYFAVNRLLF